MATDPETPPPKRRARKLPLWRRCVWHVFNLSLTIPTLALLLFAGGYFLLPDRSIPLPERIEREVSDRISAQLGGRADIGEVVVTINRDGRPSVGMSNLVLNGPDGARIGQFNEVQAVFAPIDPLDLKLVATQLSVSGAQLTARRGTGGELGLQFGGGSEFAAVDPEALISEIDTLFGTGALAEIDTIQASDLTLTLEDARSGRLWQVTDGEISVLNTDDETSISLNSEVFNGTEDVAGVQMSFSSAKQNKAAVLSVRVDDMPARDIALQAPALAFLGALDAPVSGALRSVIAGDGSIETFDATLDIGEGALSPDQGATPVPFNRGRAYMSYDPDQRKILFQDLYVEGSSIRVSGRGHAYLQDFEGGWPETLLAQISLRDFQLAPMGMFDEAVDFDSGVADVRLRLNPFQAEFGQISLSEGAQNVAASGRVSAGPDGWEGRVDLTANELTPRRLLALWPVALAPQTRGWLLENLRGGIMHDVDAALRLSPGVRPNVGLTFDISDAQVGFLPSMPPVEDGWGHFALHDGLLTVQIDSGQIPDGDGGAMQMGGSSFQIEDVFVDPSMAIMRVETNSPLVSILKVLNKKPFEVLREVDFGPEAAVADARMRAEGRFPIVRDLPVEDVKFFVEGVLENAWTDQIIPGRVLTADQLEVRVTPTLLEIEGPVELDGVPVVARLEQPIGVGSDAALSRITGEIELSQKFLTAFDINLPSGALTGASTGQLEIEFSKSQAPTFVLTSDLVGAGLSLPAIGWRKAASVAGTFRVTGQLGETTEIDGVSLSAPGLTANGTIRLGEDGQFAALDLSNVQVGNWLEAPITISAGGRVQVNGGRLDTRGLPDNSGGGGRSNLIELRLEQLVLTDDITLTNFVSNVEAGNSLNGEFRGRVNGRSRIDGIMVPQRGRTAYRLRGTNAGALFRDAKLFDSLEGGTYELLLAPRDGPVGFQGQLTVESAVLRDQPVIIDMLDAVSVVGIIDQLEGPGVRFDTIQGRFHTRRNQLVLTSGSAVGASMGVSLDGTYNFRQNNLDMQGVISPIYLFNGVGSFLTRRGEGLFGFTYRLTGDAKNPRVSVNPLSILTPGMFREIFRRAPPG